MYGWNCIFIVSFQWRTIFHSVLLRVLHIFKIFETDVYSKTAISSPIVWYFILFTIIITVIITWMVEIACLVNFLWRIIFYSGSLRVVIDIPKLNFKVVYDRISFENILYFNLLVQNNNSSNASRSQMIKPIKKILKSKYSCAVSLPILTSY